MLDLRPAHVNALIDAQELTFAPGGLTVAYGDNASGKSGHARLIKAVARARHCEPVHADALSLRVAGRHTIKTRRGELWVSRHEERVSPGIDDPAQARCERRNLVGPAPAFV